MNSIHMKAGFITPEKKIEVGSEHLLAFCGLACQKYLKEHPEVMAEVEQKVREKYSKDDTDDKKKEEIPDTDSFSDSIDDGIPAATEEAGE